MLHALLYFALALTHLAALHPAAQAAAHAASVLLYLLLAALAAAERRRPATALALATPGAHTAAPPAR